MLGGLLNIAFEVYFFALAMLNGYLFLYCFGHHIGKFSKNFPKTCLKKDKMNRESLIKWHPVEVHFIGITCQH